ncbi:MAG: FtsX-like permease family protein [Desulfofustis sp.]|nr:FtsX-like permease family protein [Desulfofustis sp.]NNK55747.1 FtsX-like permease family protein [Desulfofustis sp.]
MAARYLDRQLNIADYALGGLTRRLGKNLVVVLVFALVIFMVASFSMTTTSLKHAASQLLTTVPDITVQKMSAGRQVGFSTEAIKELEFIFGIRSVQPRVWGYYFDENNGANYTVIGVTELGDKTQLAGLGIDFLPNLKTDAAFEPAVIGRGVRENLGLGNRRAFSLFRPDLSLKSFVTSATFDAETSMVTDDLIIMDLKAARDLFGLQADEITDLLVDVANPLEIDNIADNIGERLKGVRVVTRERIGKTYRVAFGWRSGFGLACLFGAVAAFFIFAWDKASGLTPAQQQEIAILKVLGWQTEDIITLRFWESVIISISAFGLGYLAAWIHLLFFNGLLFRPVLLGWSVVKPPLSLVPVFSFADLLIIFSLSVLPYLAATVIPAWHSATIRPDSVI